MTNFLIKAFIKDHENTKNPNVRKLYGFLAAIVCLAANFMLFISKIIIGYFLSSVSITTDAFNNLSDMSSALVILLGAKISSKPPDKEHPFGHGRTEYLITLAISCIIIALGVEFLKESVLNLIHPKPLNFNLVSVMILFLTVVVKLWLSRFNKTLGIIIDSEMLMASSQDSINDVLITSATIFSVIFAKFTGVNIDGYAGIIVSVILILSGYNIAKSMITALIGQPADKNTLEKIHHIIKFHKQVLGTHDLVVHSYGPNKILASLHVELPTEMKMMEAHEIVDSIEEEILQKLGIAIVIHIDPVEINDIEMSNLMGIVEKTITDKNLGLCAHDFRIFREGDETKFLFELVVPYEYTSESMQAISNEISKNLRESNEKINCLIKFETSYIE